MTGPEPPLATEKAITIRASAETTAHRRGAIHAAIDA